MILSMDIKTIANKKARGIMPLIEGKSPYHFLVMLKLSKFNITTGKFERPLHNYWYQ